MATCGPENIIQKAVTGQWTFYCQQTSPHASCVLELVLEQLSLRIDVHRLADKQRTKGAHPISLQPESLFLFLLVQLNKRDTID